MAVPSSKIQRRRHKYGSFAICHLKVWTGKLIASDPNMYKHRRSNLTENPNQPRRRYRSLINCDTAMTSTKPAVVLPLDVRLLIMDSLPELSFTHARLMYTTLRACALTCRAWLPYARRRLYNAVQLATPTDCELFSRTIGSCPDLAILVKQIDCCFTPYDGWNCDDRDQQYRIQTPLPCYIVNRLLSLKLARFSTGGFLATVPFFLFIRSFAVCPQLNVLSLYDVYSEAGDNFTGTIWSFPSITHLQIRACHSPFYDDPARRLLPSTITKLDVSTGT